MIDGELVKLRPITVNDTDLIVKWRNNPEVRKRFLFREPFTAEMHNKWMEEKVFTGEVIQYIIEEKFSCTSVGSVYYRDIDKIAKTAEFGIFIGEDFARNKGYGSETEKLFLNYGRTVGLKKIFLRVIRDNDAAIRSYLKSGFYPIKQVEEYTSDGEKVLMQYMEKSLL